jgi:hypothetical protein
VAIRRLLATLTLIACLAAASGAHAASGPPGLALHVSSSVVHVGEDVSFTLNASSWPAPARVTLSFLSAHHGFSGAMLWDGQCGCFRLTVSLAMRIHPLEPARATAKVTYDHVVASASTSFQIRGLAKNGKDFASGGATILSGWVSDPSPVPNEFQHFCAWTHTVDFIAVTGKRVGFVVHYKAKTDSWNPGNTIGDGILCSNRSVGQAQPGLAVPVDVWAGSLHMRTSFTPRPAVEVVSS